MASYKINMASYKINITLTGDKQSQCHWATGNITEPKWQDNTITTKIETCQEDRPKGKSQEQCWDSYSHFVTSYILHITFEKSNAICYILLYFLKKM